MISSFVSLAMKDEPLVSFSKEIKIRSATWKPSVAFLNRRSNCIYSKLQGLECWLNLGQTLKSSKEYTRSFDFSCRLEDQQGLTVSLRSAMQSVGISITLTLTSRIYEKNNLSYQVCSAKSEDSFSLGRMNVPLSLSPKIAIMLCRSRCSNLG